MSETKATFSSGATSSSEKPRYDLIPVAALRRLAARFGYGARKHGDHNYKQGVHDPEFVRDRVNHMIEHAAKYANGDRSTDHLGAVMCNAAMLAEMERIREDEGEKVPVASIQRDAELRGVWTGRGASGRAPVDTNDRDATTNLRDCCHAPSASGLRCTRTSGHTGDHVAHYGDGTIGARWEQEPLPEGGVS